VAQDVHDDPLWFRDSGGLSEGPNTPGSPKQMGSANDEDRAGWDVDSAVILAAGQEQLAEIEEARLLF